MSSGIKSSIKLDGGRELARFLKELPVRVLKKALRQAVTVGSTPMTRAVRRRAPKLSGTLRKAIKRKVKVYSNGNAIALIGADRAVESQENGRKSVPANYIHLITGGTKPHGYKSRKGTHPGAKANPFLAEAVNETKQSAGKAMEQKLAQVLASEAAKMGGRG